MDENGTFAGQQQGRRVGNAATGFQQLGRFIRNGNGDPEVVGGQVFPDLPGEMVDIHHQMGVAGIPQFADNVVQKRLSSHGHQSLGHSVGDGLQTGSQPRRKDHRLHT